MDLGLPEMNGIEAPQKVKEIAPNTKVIILTSHDREEEVLAALGSGASAYCLKDIDPNTLVSVIKNVSKGACWLDSNIAHLALKFFPKPESTEILSGSKGNDTKTKLTEREQEAILNLRDDVRKREDVIELFDDKRDIYSDRRVAYYGMDETLINTFMKHSEEFYPFFEVNEKSLKTYFDPFALYVTPKEEYEDQNQGGMISSTTASGLDYWDRMVSSIEKPLVGSRGFDLSTPREIIQREDRRLINRIRNRNVQKELDSMFESQNLDNSINNQSKK